MTKITIKRILLLTIVLVGFWSCSNDPASPPENMLEIEGEVRGPAGVTEKENDPPDTKKTFKTNNSSDAINGSANTEKLISGEIPLTGVSVSAFELSDYISNQQNATLLATDKTDQDGNYLLTDIEEGIDLVLVVESTPRQTSIILNTRRLISGDVNSATSIVSEYWAGELANGTDFNQSEYDELLDTASELLADILTDQLLSILSELVPERFGDGFPGNLSSEAKRFVNTLNGLDFAACEDIVFEKSSGKPTNSVIINGISVEFIEEPLGWVYDSDNIDEENRFGVYIERISDNQAELLIPIHPDNYIDGGSVMIEIYDENQSITCPGISFEIEPLTKVSGTFEQMISKLEVTFQKMAQEFGYSSNDLISVDVTELPDEVKAIAAGIQTIDGSNNPNSIRNILSGDAPILEGEPLNDDVLELFDALFDESGLSEKVISANEVFNSQAKSNSTGSVGNCIVLPENISTPGELNCWMGVQAWFENANQGLSREIRDATGAVLGIGGVVALGTGLGAPVAAALGMSATAVTMMQIFIDANDNTLPSQLLGFEIWGNPAIYENEDDDTEGVWSADLVAQSNGWTLDWPTTLGNVPGLGKAAGILNKTKMPNVVEFLIENFQREANNIWKSDSGPINIPPQIQRVTIDINRDVDYINWELKTKTQETNIDPFSFTQDEQGYTPEAVGTADLRIETKGGDVFKGQKVFNILELEVEPINITLAEYDGLSPIDYRTPISMNVEDELFLEARVENANNKEVRWSIKSKDDGLVFLELPGINYYITIKALDTGRYTVEAESVADTGPRTDNYPRRYDRVTIVVGGLEVSNPGCVETDEAYQLTASMGGESVDFSELEWDINGPGSIDSDGVYTAGETGDVQINFQIKDQPEITDTINFTVQTECSYIRISSEYFNEVNRCPAYASIPPPEGRFDTDQQALIDDALNEISELSDEALGALSDISVIVGWNAPTIGLPVVADLDEPGEWTKTLVTNIGIEPPLLEWLVFLEDSNGILWFFNATYSELKINRQELTVDGETVPVFDGTFYTTLVELVTGEAEPRVATVEGEFKGIREWGCIPGE